MTRNRNRSDILFIFAVISAIATCISLVFTFVGHLGLAYLRATDSTLALEQFQAAVKSDSSIALGIDLLELNFLLKSKFLEQKPSPSLIQGNKRQVNDREPFSDVKRELIVPVDTKSSFTTARLDSQANEQGKQLNHQFRVDEFQVASADSLTGL